MSDPTRPLSIDEAMAEFQAIALDVLADAPRTDGPPLTPAQTEEGHFQLAESVLRLACPDPRMCGDQRCQRGRQCRHFAHVRALQQGQAVPHHPRRPPGAEAVRYAVWVFMNSGR